MLTRAVGQQKHESAVWLAVFGAVCFSTGCTALNPFAPLPVAKTPSVPASARLHADKQTFTGKVVLVTEGYRLRLTDSDDVVRLTRAKRASEFGPEEVDLRKYYEKNLAIRGSREGEWLWDAEIVGQWLQHGEGRGPNLLAPPAGR